MDILKVLEVFYSEHEWTIVNDDYEGLVWSENNSAPKPTLEELEEKWNYHKAPIDEQDVQRQRQVEIMAVWPMDKQFEAITEFHMDRPEKMDALVEYIEEVKQKYPKSTSD